MRWPYDPSSPITFEDNEGYAIRPRSIREKEYLRARGEELELAFFEGSISPSIWIQNKPISMKYRTKNQEFRGLLNCISVLIIRYM